jgi:hypothetical protein
MILTKNLVGGEGEGVVFPGSSISVGGEKAEREEQCGVFFIGEMEIQNMSLVRTRSPKIILTQGLVRGFLGIDTMSRFRSEKGRILSGNLPPVLWQRMFMGKRSNTMVEFLFLVNKSSGQPDIQQLFDNLWGIRNFLRKETDVVCLPKISMWQSGWDWDQVCDFLTDMLGDNLQLSILVLPETVLVRYQVKVRCRRQRVRLEGTPVVRAEGASGSSNHA